jgi:hypothetical protein
VTYEPRPSPVAVTALPVGAVRVSAVLQPEEARAGGFVRDLHPETARALADELRQAADEAEEKWRQLNEGSGT